MEHYPSGQLRFQYLIKPQTGRKAIFKPKYIQAETWSPKGRSTGKVIDGNGILLEGSAKPDSLTGLHYVRREEYRDSLLVEARKLDSAGLAEWHQ